MFVYRLAALLAYAIIETVWRTGRLRFDELDRLQTLVREHGAVVPVFWHQHLLHVRALHRRPPRRAQDGLHDFAVGRRSGADDAR